MMVNKHHIKNTERNIKTPTKAVFIKTGHFRLGFMYLTTGNRVCKSLLINTTDVKHDVPSSPLLSPPLLSSLVAAGGLQRSDERRSPAIVVFPRTTGPEEPVLRHSEPAGGGRGAAEQTDEDLQLEDFGFPPLVLRRFCSDPDSVLDPTSTGGVMWCHVLPSMVTDCQSLQRRRRCTAASTSDRYPLSCVRLQPVQRCPRLQGALCSFLSDIRDGLQSVCGFPARLTSKPCYRTTSLNSAASVQVSSAEQVNLTTSFSIRPILTQLSAPPPLQPARSSVGSQPSAWTPLSQQAGAQRLLGNGRGFRDSLTPSRGCRRDRDGPSSLSSSRVSCSVSSGYHSAPSPSSSSSLPLYQPVSSLTSSSSSSVLPPLPPPVNSTPNLVPIFKNKHPSRHVNIALLRLQKQKEQLSRGGEERGRVTLPAIGKNRPSSSTVPSLSSLPIPPPPTIPCFNRQPSSSSNYPNLQHITSLSPTSKPTSGLMLTPKPETKFKPKTNQSTAAKSSRKVQKEAAKHSSAVTSADASSRESGRERVVFKSRAAIRDVDVEKMARSNQLSRLNSAALLSWLKGRGVLVSAKHKKEELMLKVLDPLTQTYKSNQANKRVPDSRGQREKPLVSFHTFPWTPPSYETDPGDMWCIEASAQVTELSFLLCRLKWFNVSLRVGVACGRPLRDNENQPHLAPLVAARNIRYQGIKSR
ncbi:hypothetical protein PAMP_010885 [Pampus punctatissimus]